MRRYAANVKTWGDHAGEARDHLPAHFQPVKTGNGDLLRDGQLALAGEQAFLPGLGFAQLGRRALSRQLDLGQREAAEIFGGGINAFSRYENGKTKPPLALVKLLKVLDRHPELLSEIRAA